MAEVLENCDPSPEDTTCRAAPSLAAAMTVRYSDLAFSLFPAESWLTAASMASCSQPATCMPPSPCRCCLDVRISSRGVQLLAY